MLTFPFFQIGHLASSSNRTGRNFSLGFSAMTLVFLRSFSDPIADKRSHALRCNAGHNSREGHHSPIVIIVNLGANYRFRLTSLGSGQ
ncbi:hypothetical protein BDM02DRAFT_500086 [Thelephora ganbajun]|uniref:Uncharacterized protein n=1 Tax=Thelephora ganbajun TaxID=370292 RepID=A0ACB6Z7N3_THEGA|nr:hypothetical protein BDM02DRAFT_500086 [Thelephora ganbajun]